MLKKIGLSVALIVFCPMLVARSQAAPTESSVIQQLAGRWEKPITDTSSPAPGGFRFFPDGRVIWSLPGGYDFATRIAIVGTYMIDPKPKPMHIHFQFGNSEAPREDQPPVVFEFQNPRSLLLQQSKSWNPGQFEQPPEFTKVSDQTVSLPESAQLTQAEQSKTGEGQLMMQHLTLSALYYSVEKKQFPKTLSELGLSSGATRNYRYQLQAKANQLTLIALPTQGNLNSYIAIVAQFPQPNSDEVKYIAAKACQSVRPSRSAPSVPRIPDDRAMGTNLIECSSSSKEIDL
ncbi:type IV pilin-like G/H family protein [Leptolyngbya sp. AN10]|uniref:type IV pilin-like G/H family protein n=1 Tax=Leptolyngbya sp. AN10 TaxID=3423365 RepID=UPI003D321B8F